MIGKYLDDALRLANMSQAELARRSGMKPPMVSKVMKGKFVGRDILLQWCDIMQTPDWLEELILNEAEFASRKQKERADKSAEEAHRRVLEELKKQQGK